MCIIRSLDDITSLQERLAFLRMGGCNSLFRGHEDESYRLIADLFRSPARNDTPITEIEQNLYRAYESYADSLDFNLHNPMNRDHGKEWFYLSQGRHLGLKCRLLDWSASLKNAVFFAVNDTSKHNVDGALWILFCQEKPLPDRELAEISPFALPTLHIVTLPFMTNSDRLIANNPIADRNRFRQYGKFTITPLAMGDISLDENDWGAHVKFRKIIIPRECKPRLLAELNEQGITMERLVPSRNTEEERVVAEINRRFSD